MARSYWNVSAYKVLDGLRFAVPCNCNRNPFNYPTYNVRTRTSTSYCVGKGPVVKSIIIECSSCGSTKETDIESMNIYENDLDSKLN